MILTLDTKDKYLLYIDVLGFTQLVESDSERIQQLYTIIDSLNVHKHEAFSTIVFSDTILVYNRYDPTTEADHQYFVMYAIEFAQDLLYRTIGQSLFFRAVLTYGRFDHYKLKNVECFYGPALISAYKREKAIYSTGLFIDNVCNNYNDIFKSSRYDDSLHFVYLTQPFERLWSDCEGKLPAPRVFFEGTDEDYFILPDLRILQDTKELMEHDPDPRIRVKHLSFWQFYRHRYRGMLDFIEKEGFRPEGLCPDYDWNNAKEAFSRDYGCTIGGSEQTSESESGT